MTDNTAKVQGLSYEMGNNFSHLKNVQPVM